MPLRPDRRTQNTRAELHDALASLVHEKPYDDIVVKEILARADVARSTFYEHYRGKDDLLEDGMRDMLRADQPPPPSRWAATTDRLLWFSRPFLDHVERFREDGAFAMDGRSVAELHDRLRRVLERVLADSLPGELRPHSDASDERIPIDLLARHIAGTFVLVLEWWYEHPTLHAREVDARFRTLVEPLLGQSRRL